MTEKCRKSLEHKQGAMEEARVKAVLPVPKPPLCGCKQALGSSDTEELSSYSIIIIIIMKLFVLCIFFILIIYNILQVCQKKTAFCVILNKAQSLFISFFTLSFNS